MEAKTNEDRVWTEENGVTLPLARDKFSIAALEYWAYKMPTLTS